MNFSDPSERDFIWRWAYERAYDYVLEEVEGSLADEERAFERGLNAFLEGRTFGHERSPFSEEERAIVREYCANHRSRLSDESRAFERRYYAEKAYRDALIWQAAEDATDEIDMINSLSDEEKGLSDEKISEHLKIRSYDGKGKDVCAICLDDLYEQNQEIGVVDCGHGFHPCCIKKWLQKKNVCPLCQAIALVTI